MLRIGFVGTGLIAWAHALGLQAGITAGVLDASMTAVHDRDPARASSFAGHFGAAAFGSTAEVVAHSDAVWVCTPTAAHRGAVEAAAAMDRALFCEKPLATDLAGAEAMAALVTSSGVPAQVGLVLRSTPVFRALRDLLASGELGPPMAVVFRDDQYFPIQGLYASAWRSDLEVAGGGCLLEHSIHDLDILRFCLGDVIELSCRTANYAGYEGIEDTATVSLRFSSGASAELVSVWHDILSRGSTRRVEVFCRRGMVWLDNDFLGPLHIQTSEGAEERPCPSPGWVRNLPLGDDEIGLAIRMYADADRALVDAIGAARRPQPDFGEGVIAHRLVDAAYRSAAAGGTPVTLPEVPRP